MTLNAVWSSMVDQVICFLLHFWLLCIYFFYYIYTQLLPSAYNSQNAITIRHVQSRVVRHMQMQKGSFMRFNSNPLLRQTLNIWDVKFPIHPSGWRNWRSCKEQLNYLLTWSQFSFSTKKGPNTFKCYLCLRSKLDVLFLKSLGSA